MNANDDRLAVLILDAVLAHRRRLGDEQAISDLIDQVVADAFPEATEDEIRAIPCDRRRAAAAAKTVLTGGPIACASASV